MNATTLLLRQVHPNFVQNGRVSSIVFRPTPKDEQKLSVYDGDQISPNESWEHYTRNLELCSRGVVAVSKEECEDVCLLVSPDPEPYPEHVVIDFSAYSKGQTEKKAKLLKAKAATRGWLYMDSPN